MPISVFQMRTLYSHHLFRVTSEILSSAARLPGCSCKVISVLAYMPLYFLFHVSSPRGVEHCQIHGRYSELALVSSSPCRESEALSKTWMRLIHGLLPQRRTDFDEQEENRGREPLSG